MSSPIRKITTKKRISVTKEVVDSSSPQRLSMVLGSTGSPGKWKALAAAVNPNVQSMNIVREMNREDNLAQNKDIEIERLRTTTIALNTHVDITDEVKHQRDTSTAENAALRKENDKLRATLTAQKI